MKNVLKILSLALIVTILVFSFSACAKAKDETPEVKGYDIPESLEISVDVYNGNTLLGSITKEGLEGATQQKITMTTTNSQNTESTVTYVAYKVSNLLFAIENFNLPAFTKVKTVATDGYDSNFDLSSIDNMYLTIGTEENGAFVEDSKAPRLITDKTSTSSNSITKYMAKLVFNPVVFSLTVKMTQGDKENIIILPSTIALTEYERESKNEIVTYLGYNLSEIIASMTKIKKDNTVMNLVGDYDTVGFVCSDDEEATDYSARVFTKEEIDNEESYVYIVTDGEGTRCYSDLADTDPATYRNKLKNISVIEVYTDGVLNCKFEFTWSVPAV